MVYHCKIDTIRMDMHWCGSTGVHTNVGTNFAHTYLSTGVEDVEVLLQRFWEMPEILAVQRNYQCGDLRKKVH